MWKKCEKRENKNNCKTEEQIIEDAKKIIIKNLLKPLLKQQKDLHENNIFLKDDKIYRIITKKKFNLSKGWWFFK
jgi:hypothetical protein